MGIDRDRRNVLKILGTAALSTASAGTYSGNTSAQKTYTLDDVENRGDECNKELETGRFELWGLHDIVVDDQIVDDTIMYNDVTTVLEQYDDLGKYEVIVTYDTDIVFCPDPTPEDFAVYDLYDIDYVSDGTLNFARHDHDDESSYSFERVFFDEWFYTVDQLERIFDENMKIGVDELGVDRNDLDHRLRFREPLAYWLQVHEKHGGKYYLHVPGETASRTDPETGDSRHGDPTKDDFDAWESILCDPALVKPGSHT